MTGVKARCVQLSRVVVTPCDFIRQMTPSSSKAEFQVSLKAILFLSLNASKRGRKILYSAHCQPEAESEALV